MAARELAQLRQPAASAGASRRRSARSWSNRYAWATRPHGHLVEGPLDHLDRVAGSQLALLDDAEVGARPLGAGEALDEQRVAHALGELPARDPRRGDLERRRADRPALADQRAVHVDAAGGEVLAPVAWSERPTELGLPPLGVLGGIGIDGLVGAAVHAAVGLVVAIDVHAANGYPAAQRLLPDRAGGGLAVALDRARLADVHRFDRWARHVRVSLAQHEVVTATGTLVTWPPPRHP